MKTRKLTSLIALALSSMALAAVAQPAKPGAATTQTTAAEAQYQGAASPLAGAAMHQSSNPKAPPMTEEEFARARQFILSAAPVATVCCAKARPASL